MAHGVKATSTNPEHQSKISAIHIAKENIQASVPLDTLLAVA